MTDAAPPAPPQSDTRWIDQRAAEQDQAMGLGLFAVLRELERRAGKKPRIGRNTRLRDALVRLGQDPFLAFPDTDLARVDMSASPPRLRAQFLGFFGAFGAFPLNWTEEIRQWYDAGDESFVQFIDIFAARFQELFFRAWSDARPISQYDHPADDRFQTYLLAMVGLGSPAFHRRDGVHDTVKLRLLPLTVSRVKSPVRLEQMLAVHFGDGVTIEIEEMVPTWLSFEPDALCRMGVQASTLGRDIHLGKRVRSISEKFRINVRVLTLQAYERFLPGGPDHAQLRDLVFWYLGQRFEIEVALWLPKPEVRPAILGESATLGWMACIAPDPGNAAQMIHATRFALVPEDPPQRLPQAKRRAA